jgi:hypothetical protein
VFTAALASLSRLSLPATTVAMAAAPHADLPRRSARVVGARMTSPTMATIRRSSALLAARARALVVTITGRTLLPTRVRPMRCAAVALQLRRAEVGRGAADAPTVPTAHGDLTLLPTAHGDLTLLPTDTTTELAAMAAAGAGVMPVAHLTASLLPPADPTRASPTSAVADAHRRATRIATHVCPPAWRTVPSTMPR